MDLPKLFNAPGLMPKGESAEAVFVELLRFFGVATDRIQDVRKEPYWQSRKVDYRVAQLDGKTLNCEVKYDRHIHKGNVLFELARINHTGKPVAYLGWSVISEAERLYVWCEPVRRMYAYRKDELQSATQRYLHDCHKNGRHANVQPVNTDGFRTTINVYVPMKYLGHYATYTRDGQRWFTETVRPNR